MEGVEFAVSLGLSQGLGNKVSVILLPKPISL